MYQKIKNEFVAGEALPVMGTNEKGEMVIISAGKNDYGEYYRTDTAQENGWVRINYFYEDGTLEEMFEK